MGIPIRSTAEIAKKWQEVTPARAAQYAEGVKSPSADWQVQTAAAAGNYATAIQASISKGRFAKGVNRAGNAAWQRGAVEKGASRFAQGVSLAGPAYAEGFEPFRAAIAGVALPPRRPAGDPGNIDRVRAVATALHAKKEAM